MNNDQEHKEVPLPGYETKQVEPISELTSKTETTSEVDLKRSSTQGNLKMKFFILYNCIKLSNL
jgi:hypothetical protein